jgi:putative tryptophan/tyrosine transport system substrate-binding protein
MEVVVMLCNTRSRIRFAVFLLVLVALSLVLSACGQSEAKVYNIGIFIDRPPEIVNYDGLKDGLKALNYVEGQNVSYYLLNTTGMSSEQVTQALKDFAAKNYDAYWTPSGSGALSLKAVVTKQPIIAAGVSNAVQRGVVKDLERPGGNITGIDSFSNDTYPQSLEWLSRLEPAVKTVYTIYDANDSAETFRLEALRTAAKQKGITLLEKPTTSKEEAAKVIAEFKASEAQAILPLGNGAFSKYATDLKKAVEREKLALVGGDKAHFQYNALISYGTTYYSLARQSAVYMDKVLHGTDPGTLPILSPNKVDLFLNQKLADQIGWKFSASLLSSADEVVK